MKAIRKDYEELLEKWLRSNITRTSRFFIISDFELQNFSKKFSLISVLARELM